MFLENRTEDRTKKYNNKLVVGLELTDSYSQVSYSAVDNGEPETISLIVGQEEYKIPTVMGKRYQSDVWLFGKEAVKASEEGECILVKDILFHAQQNMPVILDDMEYDIGEMLAVYIKKCLFLIPEVTSLDKVETVVITVRELTENLIHSLEKAAGVLTTGKTQFCFSTYQESFFQYVLHQEKNLWMQDVALFDYREDGMKVMVMKMNRRTTPIVTFIEDDQYPAMRMIDAEYAGEWEMEAHNVDLDFLTIAKRVCEHRTVSAVYLLGEGFQQDWCKESLRYICRGRRVFQGNNLYSKGACYMALEKTVPSIVMESYVYLADDKLKSNLGMRVIRDGEECYMTLLDAGCSWYEAKKDCNLILEEDNKLPIIVTPMDGKNIKVAEIVLDGLPIHGKKTNRIHVSITMKNVKTVCVTIEDCGFGEFFPSSGQIWKEEFDIA